MLKGMQNAKSSSSIDIKVDYSDALFLHEKKDMDKIVFVTSVHKYLVHTHWDCLIESPTGYIFIEK